MGGKELYFCKNTFIFIINLVSGIPVGEFSCQAFLLDRAIKSVSARNQVQTDADCNKQGSGL
ncbi:MULTISPECIES: hypothetical protein [Desulfotignum]|jgi:hypothetical protein|uniref:hypothetical protein n=1 Tax=Desulfotignum TaxID=115780 RepID=UPI000416E806|nr:MULTISPECIES: hypothetical protein [Desulfotignum]